MIYCDLMGLTNDLMGFIWYLMGLSNDLVKFNGI